ncbi:hypothetical protein QTV49_003930 [Vibrio vulnificus]|nr:hypothetical protein [Vibrio vulnificus]
MLRINSDLYLSDCGSKYAIKHSDRQWDAGEVVSLKLVKDQSSLPDGVFNSNLPVHFVYFGDFCLGYQLLLDEERLRVNAASAKEWLKPNKHKDLPSEMKKALSIRSSDIDKLDKEFGVIEVNALSNKLTVRQLLALLSAQEAGCKNFEKDSRGWSINIPENIKLKATALDYSLHDHDMEHMKSLGFLARNGKYLYQIVKHPKIGTKFDLGKAFYAQQK